VANSRASGKRHNGFAQPLDPAIRSVNAVVSDVFPYLG